MAFVVRRSDGRWEIRESYSTERGPRSRTLATFKVMSPRIIELAAAKARKRLDPAAILSAVRRAGVPIELSPDDALAKKLLSRLAHGAKVRPGLRLLLLELLGGPDTPAVDDSLAQWMGASDRDRADALKDLLDLADRLPKPRKTPLVFPGLSPSRLRKS